MAPKQITTGPGYPKTVYLPAPPGSFHAEHPGMSEAEEDELGTLGLDAELEQLREDLDLEASASAEQPFATSRTAVLVLSNWERIWDFDLRQWLEDMVQDLFPGMTVSRVEDGGRVGARLVQITATPVLI